MKNSYCITTTIISQKKEIAYGICYSLGTSGYEEYEHEHEQKNAVQLKCYFDNKEAAYQAQTALSSLDPLSVVEVMFVEQQDWNAKWRQTMKPVLVADHLWVSPAWLPPELKSGDHWIKIEPKMAFGTGHHETTRLAAQSLLILPMSESCPPALLDIGAGSGILGLIGNYKGYGWCVGVEIDPDCRENFLENINLNAPSTPVKLIIGTVASIKPRGIFNTIVMNMIRTHSEPLLEKCYQLCKPQGILIWSGLLNEEKDAAVSSARQQGWHLKSESNENEWWCGVFKRIES